MAAVRDNDEEFISIGKIIERIIDMQALPGFRQEMLRAYREALQVIAYGLELKIEDLDV